MSEYLLLQAIDKLGVMVQNPDRIIAAGKNAADAIRLTEKEVKERDEYSRVIKEADTKQKKIDADLKRLTGIQNNITAKGDKVTDDLKALKQERADLDEYKTKLDEREAKIKTDEGEVAAALARAKETETKNTALNTELTEGLQTLKADRKKHDDYVKSIQQVVGKK